MNCKILNIILIIFILSLLYSVLSVRVDKDVVVENFENTSDTEQILTSNGMDLSMRNISSLKQFPIGSIIPFFGSLSEIDALDDWELCDGGPCSEELKSLGYPDNKPNINGKTPRSLEATLVDGTPKYVNLSNNNYKTGGSSTSNVNINICHDHPLYLGNDSQRYKTGDEYLFRGFNFKDTTDYGDKYTFDKQLETTTSTDFGRLTAHGDDGANQFPVITPPTKTNGITDYDNLPTPRDGNLNINNFQKTFNIKYIIKVK
jgi:hypothetical protein